MDIRDILIPKDKNIIYCAPECCDSVIDFRENSGNTERNLSKKFPHNKDSLGNNMVRSFGWVIENINSRFYWLY